MYYGIIKNQIEDVVLIYDKNYVLKLLFQNSENFFSGLELADKFHREENFSLFLDAKEQVLDYLSQKRKSFNLPLKIPELSSFEGAVYKELIKVPYGETLSYQELAMFSGHEKAFRAVGSTLAKNDLCLLIPCHRILRKNGELGGYRAGTSIKQKLLDLEKSNSFCSK